MDYSAISLSKKCVQHLKVAKHELQEALSTAAHKNHFYGLGVRFTLNGYKELDFLNDTLESVLKSIQFFELEILRETKKIGRNK